MTDGLLLDVDFYYYGRKNYVLLQMQFNKPFSILFVHSRTYLVKSNIVALKRKPFLTFIYLSHPLTLLNLLFLLKPLPFEVVMNSCTIDVN